nr:MAG TPA: hypothetical protein [Caudoviricetes sp.]
MAKSNEVKPFIRSFNMFNLIIFLIKSPFYHMYIC